jgi:hypothetical protein
VLDLDEASGIGVVFFPNLFELSQLVFEYFESLLFIRISETVEDNGHE